MAATRIPSAKPKEPHSIRYQLRWLVFIGTCGLLIFAGVASTALLQIRVNSPLYKTISLSNNLIADYVPPSESLLEPSLVCAKLVDAPDPQSRLLYQTELKAFQHDYDVKYADYMTRVPEGQLKEMMRGDAHETAQEYFKLADQLVALVNENRVDEARALLVSTMNPLYDRHAAAVDQIVLRAKQEAHAAEELAASSVGVYTAAMVTIGLLILFLEGALSWYLARGISAQADSLARSEESLGESEELYRSTFDQAAVGILHVSFEGRILRCNARFAEIVGYPIDEIQGKTIQQFTPPDYVSETTEAFDQLVKGEANRSGLEKPYLRKDGTLTWVKLTSSIQRDRAGESLHLITFMQDINERKVAEKHLATATNALQISESLYRTVFQTSRDALSITNLLNGKLTEVNQALLDLTGFQRDEAVGHAAGDLGIWADLMERDRLIQLLRQNLSFQDQQTRLRKKNGELFWGSMSGCLIEIEGTPCAFTVTRDISEAKAAQESLAAAVDALQKSEARYRTVFQTSRDALTISDLSNGKFIEVNQAFTEIMRAERDEIVGHSSTELGFWVNPQDRENVVELLRQGSTINNEQIQLRNKNGTVFWTLLSASVIEIEGIAYMLGVTRDISDAKAAEDQIRDLAFYDRVTRIPNRRLLLDRLLQSISGDSRSKNNTAVLFVDLDDFKNVNETLGHQAGDLLLQELAKRLTSSVHEADTVARFGADEFVVILEGLSESAEDAAEEARVIGETILEAIRQPFLLEDHEYRSFASIGITVFGEKRESPNEVLQQAGIAMSQAKNAGGNTLRFFAPALQAAVSARAAMKEDLSQSIIARQFLLYYQAQVDPTGLIGAEALIRWKHPVRGMVPPFEFIPLAEETGLILPLGNLVLETACNQIAAWTDRNLLGGVQIAVNISARQFSQPDFVEHVLATLARTGANPNNLKLELTESMLASDMQDVIAKMNALRSHGLSLSLDDFGTGYSSLSYLKHLPLDQLKIDRAFVQDILEDVASASIAQTVISLGRAMGLTVIAEGVETEEQRRFLTTLGTHSFQGYLYSRPLPSEEFERQWLVSAAPPVQL
ncbi:MAG: EAL domain-containing protein [Terracidiphilus sp.]|jgi:diguanylate cyclase (GGDEF)-like protein/PAS domain S-box-containing protein